PIARGLGGGSGGGACTVMVKSGNPPTLTFVLLSRLTASLTAQFIAKFCRLAIVELVPYCLLRGVPDLTIYPVPSAGNCVSTAQGPDFCGIANVLSRPTVRLNVSAPGTV